jgi:putative two-component system response regulator
MKTHVPVGVGAIEQIMDKTKEHAYLNHAVLITGTHHEKWDGTGYPEGLKGKEIPIEGRLMAIVDVYDALISKRPYKEAFSHEESCTIIESGADTHFDPMLVEVFKKVKHEFEKIVQRQGG